ncbi:hypothetical protein LTR86_008415 [Recurvomyces mirabilis]|nr:hypothetical protein LTR86_008415 [Recurvomyces mirabilis]
MPLWQSWRGLSTRTRVMIGGGIMAYAAFGIFVSDKAEEAFGFVPSEQDKQKLNEAWPRLHVVDKNK